MQAAFYGVGPSVIGVITLNAYKLTRKTLGRDRLLRAIYLVSAAIKHGKRPGVVAVIDGVTAAAVGAIAGACLVLGRRTLSGDA